MEEAIRIKRHDSISNSFAVSSMAEIAVIVGS